MNGLTVAGSLTPEIINISSTSNVNRPGLWIFQVDQAQIIGMYACMLIKDCMLS